MYRFFMYKHNYSITLQQIFHNFFKQLDLAKWSHFKPTNHTLNKSDALYHNFLLFQAMQNVLICAQHVMSTM